MLLYRGIIEGKTTPYRSGMTINLDRIRWAVKERNGKLPTNQGIWKAICNKTLKKEVRAFLWKATHNANKIGDYWEKILGYKPRGMCHACKVEESMNHILTECKRSGQEKVWKLACKICQIHGIEWNMLTFREILESHMIHPKYVSGKMTAAGIRMYQIIISESAHLIWKVRCKWKIGREVDLERAPTDSEIKNK